MVFSSVLFLVYYLVAVLLIYYVTPLKWRNIFLLIVNCIFYGWGEPLYISIMFLSTVIDYINGYFVAKYRDTDRNKAKKFMIVDIIANLSILCFFKYSDFIISNLNLLGLNIPLLNLSLPIGISFYTFQTMSYTIDIYRYDANVQKNIFDFATYVTLFPQLIAGPIVRYKDVDEQLRVREHSVDKFSDGINRFVIGLSKKVLLANNIGILWETIKTSNFSELSILGAWLGTIAFAFQIYFDFSGYSDMAVGLGKMLGFEFMENFNYPYISKSITEFWRRWHISLSTWFREYVYIPLGGNRKGKARTLINLAIVWLLTGLWHGASWNFVMWGAYFGILLILEKLFLKQWIEKLPAFFQHAYTLILVLISWVMFELIDISSITSYLSAMFGLNGAPLINTTFLYQLRNNLILLVILCLAATPFITKKIRAYNEKKEIALTPVVMGVLLVLCLMYIVDASYNPFLYFRF